MYCKWVNDNFVIYYFEQNPILHIHKSDKQLWTMDCFIKKLSITTMHKTISLKECSIISYFMTINNIYKLHSFANHLKDEILHLHISSKSYTLFEYKMTAFLLCFWSYLNGILAALILINKYLNIYVYKTSFQNTVRFL